MDFYENWVELDLNPIISFSTFGKILYTNSEAQYVLNRVNAKTLFELAVNNASTTYGTKTTYVDLPLKNYLFYALTVTYKNDEEIHLKLYKSTSTKKEASIKQQNTSITNIFTLLDLCISTQKIKSKTKFIKNYDPSIPEFRLVASDLIKLLSLIYTQFNKTKEVTSVVKLKIGEYLRVEGKKYSLVSVQISSNEEVNLDEIKEDNYSSFILSKEDNKVFIDLPLILE